MVSCHCFLLFSVVLRSIQLSLSRFAVLGNHQSLVCVLALLPSLTLTSCRVLGNRRVIYLSTVSCNLLVEFWAIEHLQLSFGSLDLVRSSYSPGSGSGRPPHLHQVNRCVKAGVVTWLITGTFTRICCIRTGIGSDTYHCDCWIRCLASSPTSSAAS